jgi:hypothetical protein
MLPDEIITGDLLLEPCISLIYAWKTNNGNNHSFSLLIMYGSSYMLRYYIASLRKRSSAFWEMLNWGAFDRILWMGVLCLVSQKALGTLPEEGNVMPKPVGATVHN